MVAKSPIAPLVHPAPEYRMISAARGQTDADQPACRGALLPVWLLTTVDQAFMIWIALSAYRWSLVMYQASASVYAAMASSRSSVHPLFGWLYAPHSTVARGLGVRDRDAYELAFIWS